MRNKRIVTILMIFTIIFTLMGGTLAYFNWQTNTAQQTSVAFTVKSEFSCAADIGGNVSSNDARLIPTDDCTSEDYAIQRTVTVRPTISANAPADLTVSMNLWLEVESITGGISNSNNFRYALTTSPSSCSTGVVSSGNFKGTGEGSRLSLLSGKKYSATTTETYYLYIWLDAAETDPATMDQTFELSIGGICSDTPSPYTESILNGADPVLETGMIPVTISDTGAVTVADTSTEWYSYTNKQWANAVLVNSTSRGTYINQDGSFNGGTSVAETDILAYYVWIPRYKYTFPKANGNPETISIVFENSSTTKSLPASGKASGTDYYTHPAFTFGTNNELNGIWVGKFETAHSTLTSSSSSDNDNLTCTDENCANANGLMWATHSK